MAGTPPEHIQTSPVVMRDLPKTGTRNVYHFNVEQKDTVTFPGLPPVLSTPALVWHLETAAMQLLEPTLDTPELSVGTQIEIDHTGPALVGDAIECVATVVQAQGTEILFRVEAIRCGRVISRGLHRRRVVTVEQVRRKLSR